jgi:hypothetical protein
VGRFIRALIVLHRTFRSRPVRDRVHTLVRFLTCPFLRVVDAVPRGASLLDLGAGHGVFAVLATAFADARVVAVEPDARKVRRIAGVRSVIGYDACIRGSFDAVSIIDVLYKIPLSEWDALLARIDAPLLIVKEQDPTARIKNAWNRAQERLASALGLTLGASFSYEPPEAFAARLRRHGWEDVQWRRIDFGYPHPHVLYVAKRP